MPIDTDRQQEDQDEAARVRAGTSLAYAATARNFHLRLARLEEAIEAAVNSHACIPGDCGICLAGRIINGDGDWNIEHDYNVEPAPPTVPSPDPMAPRKADNKAPRVDPSTVTDKEAF